MVEIHSKGPMTMCPMASMCKGITAKLPSLPLLMVPGLVFIIVGIMILLEPKILVWLVAAVTIMLGVLLLLIAAWIHRTAVKNHSAHG